MCRRSPISAPTSARLRALPAKCGMYLPPARLLLPCPCFLNAAHMHHIFIPACAHLPHILIFVITVRLISPRHGPPPKASIRCRHPSWRWPRCVSGCASRVALPRLFMRSGQWQLAISVCIGTNNPSAVVSVLSTSCFRTRSGFFCAPVSLRRTSTAGGSHCMLRRHICVFLRVLVRVLVRVHVIARRVCTCACHFLPMSALRLPLRLL